MTRPLRKTADMDSKLFNVCGGLQLDLDLHTSGQLQGHQSLDGLGSGLGDVDQTLVGAALELLAAVLVLMDGAQDGDDFLLGGRRIFRIRFD